MTCLEKDRRTMEDSEEYKAMEDETMKKRKLENIPRYKYLGESSRSAYERGKEHQKALEKLDKDNHLMKHVANFHQGEEMSDVRFGLKILSHPRSAFERQVQESVKIQDEQKSHELMNSRSEYNRCALPRLTAQLGERDSEKRRKEEMIREKEEEEIVQREVLKRKKEKMEKMKQERRGERNRERGEEDQASKRRKLGEEGKYKKVKQIEPYNREERRDNLTEEKREEKKIKLCREEGGWEGVNLQGTRPSDGMNSREPEGVMPPTPSKYPQTVRGGEDEEKVDWERETEKKDKHLREREEKRKGQVEKAAHVDWSWELLTECCSIIKENDHTWRRGKERKIEECERRKREERIELAKYKGEKCKEKVRMEKYQIRIDSLLGQIPVTEQERIRRENLREERLEFGEMQENLWKRWRDKRKLLELKGKENTTEEKVEKKLRSIAEKVRKYQQEKREKDEKAQREKEKRDQKQERKRVLEDHWEMTKWLIKYIKENKYIWERRREMQEEDNMLREEMERWEEKTREEKVEEMKEEKSKERNNMKRKERSRMGSRMWKEWREEEKEKETGENERESDDHPEEKESDDNKMDVMIQQQKEEKQRRENWMKEKMEKLEEEKMRKGDTNIEKKRRWRV